MQIKYDAGAVHRFTVPDAGKVGLKVRADNATVDQQSLCDMLHFFEKVHNSNK